MGVEGLNVADISAGNVDIEQWKIKRLIKNLESSRGNGTSMISLIIKPRDEISRLSRMLVDEYGTASNIKSRVNRLSVLSAISSTQQKLKKYNRTPPNGLIIYCGTIIQEDGKEKKINIDFEPFKPINTSLYLCDNKFHITILKELLQSNDKFGFIVMDGTGSLFATLQGSNKEVLHRFNIDLPKKHGRGGQSAVRFSRLRDEKRHNYVRRVAEVAVSLFVTNDKCNVTGLILAGSADFKTVLAQSDLLDARLQAKIIKIVDIAYGGDNGLNQAIELSQDALASVKFMQERKVIGKFFEEVAMDTGRYVYGIQDTLKALEMGCVETLIVWESLEAQRLTLKNNITDKEVILHVNTEREAQNPELYKDPESGVTLELIEKMALAEWIVQNYQNYGSNIEFVTNSSQEGSQFQKGFGGIGGLLRYKVDFNEFEPEIAEDDDSDFM